MLDAFDGDALHPDRLNRVVVVGRNIGNGNADVVPFYHLAEDRLRKHDKAGGRVGGLWRSGCRR